MAGVAGCDISDVVDCVELDDGRDEPGVDPPTKDVDEFVVAVFSSVTFADPRRREATRESKSAKKASSEMHTSTRVTFRMS